MVCEETAHICGQSYVPPELLPALGADWLRFRRSAITAAFLPSSAKARRRWSSSDVQRGLAMSGRGFISLRLRQFDPIVAKLRRALKQPALATGLLVGVGGTDRQANECLGGEF